MRSLRPLSRWRICLLPNTTPQLWPSLLLVFAISGRPPPSHSLPTVVDTTPPATAALQTPIKDAFLHPPPVRDTPANEESRASGADPMEKKSSSSASTSRSCWYYQIYWMLADVLDSVPCSLLGV